MASVAEEGRGKTAKSLSELSSKLSWGFPNRVICLGETQALALSEGELGELKHLSNLRKRNQLRFPK